MLKHSLVITIASLLVSPLAAAEPANKLARLEKAPEGLSEAITAQLDPVGYRVEGADGPVCDIWLVKTLAVKGDFKPTLSVNYPFMPGQLIGALRVPEKKIYKDFRGQELSAGTYTLRYGQQPVDGNHIGTSELADFLLALPAKIDKKPDTITTFEELSQESAQSAGSTHPAIFSLLPAKDEKAPKAATLQHDESKEFWILHTTTGSKADKAEGTVQLRLVTIGQSEA